MTTTKTVIATAVLATAFVASLAVIALPAQAATLSGAQIQAVIGLLQSFGVSSTTVASIENTLSGAEVTTSASDASISARMIGFLRLGDRGDAVKLLQILLATDQSVYPEGSVTGFFGPLTERALKLFQKKRGLIPVGFIGPQTLNALSEELEDNPLSIEDDDDDGDDSPRIGKGRLCAKIPPGHLIAPGWLKKHDGVRPVIPTCQKLPGGIAKKLGQGGTGTTTPSSDTTAPVIDDIEVTDIATTSAKVEWNTNEKATSVVNFGTTTSYDMNVNKGTTRSTSHSVSLTGLLSGTEYHYRITSVDASGNAATSTDKTFTTDAP